MRTRVALVGLFALACSCVAAAPALAAGPIVVTPSGALEGVTTGSGQEWRGIPYAAPPIGALRFRPPAPAGSWSGVRNATSFGSPCLQPDEFAPDGSVASTLGSEDCLFLNVFAPLGAAASSRLPVMVHLHGGGNTFGSGYEDASAFVSRGVIVVTLNYRLGALGFVGHPALSAEGGGSSGEYGVLDQLAALALGARQHRGLRRRSRQRDPVRLLRGLLRHRRADGLAARGRPDHESGGPG